MDTEAKRAKRAIKLTNMMENKEKEETNLSTKSKSNKIFGVRATKVCLF